MLYIKNVPNFERTIRILLGVGMIAGGLWLHGQRGSVALIAIGATMLATGFVGWCPVCKIAGRKLG